MHVCLHSNHHQFNNHLKPIYDEAGALTGSNHHQFNNHLKLDYQRMTLLASSNHHQFNNHLKPIPAPITPTVCSNHHQFNNHLKPIFYHQILIIPLILINIIKRYVFRYMQIFSISKFD